MRFVPVCLISTLLLAQSPAPTPPPEATRTPTGLAWVRLNVGTGTEKPRWDGMVVVRYAGWTADGKSFVEARKADDIPPHLLMEVLMPGMREGLLDMVVGEKRRLWIPEALAFAGAKGRPAGPVIMEVELVDFGPHPSQAPPDVAAVPADALLQRSGLATRILKPGTGTQRPTKRDWVSVHYTGWTTDGKMFDSSILRRSPELFRMTGVIDGWTEGLQLMVPGERRRFWVPQKLAYGGESGKPKGMLVFDIELLAVTR